MINLKIRQVLLKVAAILVVVFVAVLIQGFATSTNEGGPMSINWLDYSIFSWIIQILYILFVSLVITIIILVPNNKF